MKRILLVASLTLICAFTFAQEKDYKIKGFEPQIRLTFDEGIDYQRNFSFGADFLAAYRFNEIVRLGAGAGIKYINMKFEEPKYIGYKKYDAYFEAAMTIPIFANVKVDFLKTKVSPYLSVDCGYNIFIPFSKYAQDNKLGFMVRPAFGVDIRFQKCVLFIEVAYKYQSRSFSNTLATYGSYHQISQAIGVSF